jgi:hypothetical protein
MPDRKSELGGVLESRFSTWKDDRVEIETQWLKNYRAFRRQYETSDLEKIAPERSHTYLGLTRVKTLTAYSHEIAIFFRGKEKHWEVAPTPVPDAPEGVDPVEAAKNMERVIADQLREANYPTKMRSSLYEQTLYGSGAIKAGTTDIKRKKRFVKNVDGEFELKISDDKVVRPTIDHAPIFTLFPDSSAESMEDAQGVYQRHVLTRAQLKDLDDSGAFDEGTLDAVFAKYPDGNHEALGFETELRAIAKQGPISAEQPGKYDLLEYWGDYEDYAIKEILDELYPGKGTDMTPLVNIWVLGDEVLAVKFIKSFDRTLPFFIFPYEKLPQQIWGVGVPEMMESSQGEINRSARILSDNSSFSALPQVEVNDSLIDPGDDGLLRPGKRWSRRGGDGSVPLLRVYDMPNIIGPMMNVVALYKQLADDETGLPSVLQGSTTSGGSSATRSASGLSQLIGQAKLVGQSAIKNVDDLGVKPVMQMLYHFNMMWHEDETIKGDMNVAALGSSILEADETEAGQLINFANITQNPVDVALTKREKLIATIADRLHIPEGIVKDALELQEDEKARAENDISPQLAQAELEEINSKIRLNDANAERALTGAEADIELMRQKGIALSADLSAKAADIEAGIIPTGRSDGSNRDGIKSNNE